MCTAAQQHHCKFKVFRVLHRSTLQWIVLNISDVNLHILSVRSLLRLNGNFVRRTISSIIVRSSSGKALVSPLLRQWARLNIIGVGSKSKVVGARHIRNLDPQKRKTMFAIPQKFSPWNPPPPTPMKNYHHIINS